MKEVIRVLQEVQVENANLQSAFKQLQASSSRLAVAVTTPISPATKEPRIGLPEKFDGTRSKFRGFVNQIRMIIRMQPSRYPIEETQVGLIGTLLSGAALSWFSPLVEKDSPLLEDFHGFLEEFTNTFGETDKGRTATTKIHSLQQQSRAASVYAAEFRQLACDVDWDNKALISFSLGITRRRERSAIESSRSNYAFRSRYTSCVLQQSTL